MDDTPKSRLKHCIQINTSRKPKTRTSKINYDLICKYSRNCNKVTRNSNVQTISTRRNELFNYFFTYYFILASSESCTFCAIPGKWQFAFSSVTSFSPRQQPLNSEHKNHTIVWDRKFHHCAKFELYWIKQQNLFFRHCRFKQSVGLA